MYDQLTHYEYPQLYKEIRPAKELQQYIKCYWLFQKDYGEGSVEYVFPDSSYELISHRSTMSNHDGDMLPPLFVVGQLPYTAEFVSKGVVTMYCVRFYPWGLAAFGSLAAFAGGGTSVEAGRIFNEQQADELHHLLPPLNNTPSELKLTLDAFFLRHLPKEPHSQTYLQQAATMLLERSGDVHISALASHCNISRRQLARELRKITGISPKALSSRFRYERARDTLMRTPSTPMTSLALSCGYTDQSHFIREFKQYTGIPPSAYAAAFQRVHQRLQDKARVQFI